MLKTDEIQAFVQIVESGSITAAADRLALAKSAVSRRLNELEDDLGVELFHRTTRKLTLTDSGEGFYNRCVRILADLEEAEHAVSAAHHELRGQLRIAAPHSFGLLHLGPAIIDFQQQHPNLRFDIDFDDRQVDLMHEGFDLGIRIAHLKDSSLIARPLADISTVICASPEYLKKHGTPTTPDELDRHVCFTYSNLSQPHHWSFVDLQGQLQTVKVNRVMQANSGDFLKDAAVAGLGILRQPKFIAYQSIARGELVPILEDFSIGTSSPRAIDW